MFSAAMPVLIAVLATSTPRVVALAAAAHAAAPADLSAADAVRHAAAALAAERPGVSAELLLGQAWVESRYTTDATSRVVDGTRVTGRLPGTSPRGSHGPFFCGTLQAAAGRSWASCLALRDLTAGYRAGSAEVASWLRFCRRVHSRQPIRCALSGYGGGVAAARSGRSTYPARVLARAAHIRAHIPATIRAGSPQGAAATTRSATRSPRIF